MPYVDFKWVAAVAVCALVGCASKSDGPSTGSSGAVNSSQSGGAGTGGSKLASSGTGGAPSAAAPAAKLGAPATPRSWNEARLQAARRIVAANPDQTYTGKPPDMLLAIPVLSVELNADGSIRNIDVMRKPSQALDTVELAKQAIRRAAPFGDVSKLPKPWKFNETFLFNEQRKFKPMTLDQR
ncbi:MAG: hypothetical protein IT506_02605 [Aquabacterium sp.]|nr:hypothetical protein [Aquabacterium sp.]